MHAQWVATDFETRPRGGRKKFREHNDTMRMTMVFQGSLRLVSRHMVRAVHWWSLERAGPDPLEAWAPDSLARHVLTALDELLRALKCQNLRCYFQPRCNLMLQCTRGNQPLLFTHHRCNFIKAQKGRNLFIYFSFFFQDSSITVFGGSVNHQRVNSRAGETIYQSIPSCPMANLKDVCFSDPPPPANFIYSLHKNFDSHLNLSLLTPRSRAIKRTEPPMDFFYIKSARTIEQLVKG